MSTEEYFHVFESILYAAIVTQMLVGWSKMIVEKGTYRFYWVHFLMSVDFLLFMVQRYYSFRNMSHFVDITNSLSFTIVLLLPPAAGFVTAFILFPKSMAGTDFREHLMKFRLPVGLSVIIIVGYTLYRNLTHVGSGSFMSYGPHLVFILLWAAFIIFRNLKLAAFLSVFSFVVMIYFLIIA